VFAVLDLDALDAEQRHAATYAGDQLRILAGAGTGKTTTLAARVAWLVASGVPPERILLLTFTRRAARELVGRAAGMLAAADPGTSRVVGGTFHSVAHRTLRRLAVPLGLPESFSVIDQGDAADVIDLVRDEHSRTIARQRRFPRKATLLDLYSRAVNTGRPLAGVVAETAPWCDELLEPIGDICRAYVARKRSLGLLDFDDLLLYWRAAARDERLGARLAAEFDHVCVDEYQDVNALQVDVVRALCTADAPGLTIVGDDAQAIYAFRGASPEHLLDVEHVFAGIGTVTLQRNYRSTQPILDVANAVADQAPYGFRVRLHATRPDGVRPTLVRCADTDAEATAVCERVLDHREQGVPLRRQAVLVRASHHADLVELELTRRRIPYVKYGGLRFLEAAHVKDLACLFRLADNPRDQLAWFRVLQLLDGVGPATARRVVTTLGIDDGAEHDGASAGDVLLRWPLAAAELPSAVRPLADAVAAALVAQQGEPVHVHADRLRDALAPLVEGAYDNVSARLADLDALVAASAAAARLSDVAADLTLEPPQSTGDLAGPPLVDEDWLVVSTIHSAKGLEWDVVHLVHASDGNIPADMALGTRTGLDEERRLFYVAVTRAHRALHVYVPLRYHHRPRGRDDKHSFGQPSRFLSAKVRARFDESSVVHGTTASWEPVDAGAVVSLELDALF
jgi:DNA helicase II / ATP-dependent DNA helicase PcrA